jgi:hypothetical protein
MWRGSSRTDVRYRKYIQVASVFVITAFLFSAAAVASQTTPNLSAAEIIRRSVAVNTTDWKAQPKFAYREEDIKSKENSTGKVTNQQEKAYEVTMIDGTPYQRLIEVNHEPLAGAQQQQEQSKFKREIAARHHESQAQRSQRLNKYKSERTEEKLLMDQMADAFHFKLAGEQDVNGVPCYVLDANPNPNYQPPVQRARVLLGMKGRLFVDKAGYHWVRVQAEVVSPVEFGLFLARVKPGTSFELEQAPVGGVWLPKHFVQSVNTTVLGVYGMRNKEEEFYSDYHPLNTTDQPEHHLLAAAH